MRKWRKRLQMGPHGIDATGAVRNGYWRAKREWRPGDRVELALHIAAELRFADPRVPADSGRAAIQRGALVYCVESADNPDMRLHSLRLPAAPEISECPAAG